jgi:hypothetical protein
MNKRGNVDLAWFIAIIIGLLILAPVMLKVVNETLPAFSNQISNISSEASANVDYIHGSFVNFWDYIIAIAFFINVIMLFVFSFIVDTHPIFSIFYMIAAVIALMFSKYAVQPVSILLGRPDFATEVGQLPIVGFIVTKFDLILLGIIIINGIILYGKWKIAQQGLKM